jgi:hypothetical protein
MSQDVRNCPIIRGVFLDYCYPGLAAGLLRLGSVDCELAAAVGSVWMIAASWPRSVWRDREGPS